jgi:hypothetical protein
LSLRCLALSEEAIKNLQVICHCISCQKISGSAFTVNIFVPQASVTITSASQPKTYVQPHETGIPITIYFCGNCATTLYKHGGSEKFKDFFVVQAGTIDPQKEENGEKKGLDVETPDAEYWTDCRAAWLGEVEGMKQFAAFA